jgi:hypothetical protein
MMPSFTSVFLSEHSNGVQTGSPTCSSPTWGVRYPPYIRKFNVCKQLRLHPSGLVDPTQSSSIAVYKAEDLAVVRIEGRGDCVGQYRPPETREHYQRLLAERVLPTSRFNAVESPAARLDAFAAGDLMARSFVGL